MFGGCLAFQADQPWRESVPAASERPPEEEGFLCSEKMCSSKSRQLPINLITTPQNLSGEGYTVPELSELGVSTPETKKKT